MATLESYDFEGGTLTGWTENEDNAGANINVSASSSSPLTGSYSLLVDITSATADDAYISRTPADVDETDYYVQFKVNISAFNLMFNESTYARLFAFTVATVGTESISVERSTGSAHTLGGVSISAGTTYTVDAHFKRDATAGGWHIYVNDTEGENGQDHDTDGDLELLQIGKIYSSGPVRDQQIRFDDIIVADAPIAGSPFASGSAVPSIMMAMNQFMGGL